MILMYLYCFESLNFIPHTTETTTMKIDVWDILLGLTHTIQTDYFE